MKGRVQRVLVAGLLVATLSLSGCIFNIFQTAHTIGAGNVALTIGTGLFDFSLTEDSNWFLTPQARLTIGLADGVDFGLQSGMLVGLQGGDPGWIGALGDLKFAIFDDPESFALAMGFGGGYSLEALGWCVLGELLFDSNLRIFPVFIAYQPQLSLIEGFALVNHFAGGLKLSLSPNARLILEVDYNSLTFLSYGLALEIVF